MSPGHSIQRQAVGRLDPLSETPMRGAVTAQSHGTGRTTLVAQYTDPINILHIGILRTIPRLKITRGTRNRVVLALARHSRRRASFANDWQVARILEVEPVGSSVLHALGLAVDVIFVYRPFGARRRFGEAAERTPVGIREGS
jgi:hypothetical protein